MSILSTQLSHCFSLFTKSMIPASDLPLCEVLDCSIIADAFEDDSIDFGKADEDVFTPAITMWALGSCCDEEPSQTRRRSDRSEAT